MTDELRNRRILVVDDNRAIHEDFRKIFGGVVPESTSIDQAAAVLFGDAEEDFAAPRFDISSAHQGEDGVELVRDSIACNRPFTVAFVDVHMPPGCDGVVTAERIFELDKQIQVVLCTAYADYSTGDILRRFRGSDRLLILKKPFDVAEAVLLAVALNEKWRLARQANELIMAQSECLDDAQRVVDIIHVCQRELESAHLDLREHAAALTDRLQERTTEIVGTRDVTVFALAQLAESRDPETGEHLERMRSYAQVLAEHLAERGPYVDQIDEQFLEDFYRSSPLHDIGKVGIPDGVLLKPGRLTVDEFEIMKRHTLIGARALERAAEQSAYGGFLSMAALIARYHHERYDGGGYPVGLKGEQIPLPARIVAVADVFDALTSKRVYKDAMAVEEAKHTIERDSGRHFDPAVVDAFRCCYPRFLEIKAAVGEGRTVRQFVSSSAGSVDEDNKLLTCGASDVR